MKLNIIYGKAGTGKTTFLFEKVKECIKDSKDIYIVTPEQFSFTAEKRLLEESDGAVLNAEVLTFSRMAYRLINENRVKLSSIEKFGKSMLIYDILDKSKDNLVFLGKNLQNTEMVGRVITELKKHNVSYDKLKETKEGIEDKYLASKISDIEYIYNKFEEELKGKFLDENDSLTYLAKNLKDLGVFDNSVIFIDEFVRIYTTRICSYRRTYEDC